MSINKVILVGNVGAEPEIRTMQSGDKVANLSIATSERWKDKNTGEQKEKTEWHRVVVFGGAAGVVENYVKKGSKLYIEGKIQTRSWEKDGQKKYSTEIVLQGFDSKLQMLDSKNDAPKQEQLDHQAPLEDEIPF